MAQYGVAANRCCGSLRFVLAAAFSAGVGLVSAGLPAFPGAEGYGANAVGGRGGEVCYVSNLGDYAAGETPIRGSLRHAIETASGPRNILFRVSGTIRLKAALTVAKPRLTIAGQTAPGQGICLRDYPLVLAADDLVVRHVRSRLGTEARQQADAISIAAGNNIIVDHCSASWSVDETLSCTDLARNVTVQWCYIAESLNRSIHSKGPHGYGALVRSRGEAFTSFHHNLFAHHASRSPRPGTYARDYCQHFDFRNNVVYNWGERAGYDNFELDVVDMNYVANYLVAGPSTVWLKSAFEGAGPATRIFQSGNRFDTNRNGKLDGADTGWGMFGGSFTSMESPLASPAMATHAAEEAYQLVLACAGALPWDRDACDVRVTETVRKQTGRIIDRTRETGGWPELLGSAPASDEDQDGLPDYWEETFGDQLSLAVSDGEGYTELEKFLQFAAEPHVIGVANKPMHLDLARMLGSSAEHLSFTVASLTHATGSLSSNGKMSRISPEQDYVGMAELKLMARDQATGASFGPVRVRLLFTKDKP